MRVVPQDVVSFPSYFSKAVSGSISVLQVRQGAIHDGTAERTVLTDDTCTALFRLMCLRENRRNLTLDRR